MSDVTYLERLKKLKLPTLSFRRTRSDMIELYKITNHVYEEELGSFVRLQWDEDIRSSNQHHDIAIYAMHCRTAISKKAFINRLLTLWNILPACQCTFYERLQEQTGRTDSFEAHKKHSTTTEQP